jgi:hypothetical protein
MKWIFVSLSIFFFSFIRETQAQVAGNTISDTVSGMILILSALDVNITSHKNATYSTVRSKKERELTQMLTDSLQQTLVIKLRENYNRQAEVIQETISPAKYTDSLIQALMKTKNASAAIVISEVNIYFLQTGVEVERNSEGSKTRTASYDICSLVWYDFFVPEKNSRNSKVEKCEFHSERGVLSGLLAAGPSVVKKKKDAFKQIPKNVDMYLMEISSELK